MIREMNWDVTCAEAYDWCGAQRPNNLDLSETERVCAIPIWSFEGTLHGVGDDETVVRVERETGVREIRAACAQAFRPIIRRDHR